MKPKRLCPICHEHLKGANMCRPCARSYDRTARRTGTVLEAMEWAARRARRFAAKASARRIDRDLRFDP